MVCVWASMTVGATQVLLAPRATVRASVCLCVCVCVYRFLSSYLYSLFRAGYTFSVFVVHWGLLEQWNLCWA